MDHTEFSILAKDGSECRFLVLVAIDAASHLLFAVGVESKDTKRTIAHCQELFMLWNIYPKAVCADTAFFEEEFQLFWNLHQTKMMPTGPNTPWPNRAETAV